LGSVTSKVLHDAHCPVWTGAHLDRAEDRGWHGIEKVVCAVDDTTQNERVLGVARDLAREFQAPLAVVHAVPKIEAPGGFLDDETRQKRITSAAAMIQRAQATAGVEGEAIIREGEPAGVVSRVVKEQGASVVVIGRSPAQAESGRLRTHAYAIIRDSPCPVISVTSLGQDTRFGNARETRRISPDVHRTPRGLGGLTGLHQRLQEDSVGNAGGQGGLLRADPIFRLPMFPPVVGRPVDEELAGLAPDPGLRAILVSERARLP
jgi:nucleotide-binding universal stress UspA family protein